MLLDDPLSAVDPRVGRILFNECLGPQGIMQVPLALIAHRPCVVHAIDATLTAARCFRALDTHACS